MNAVSKIKGLFSTGRGYPSLKRAIESGAGRQARALLKHLDECGISCWSDITRGRLYELRDHLEEVTAYYRRQLEDNGFDIIPGVHPCVPVMLYDEKTAAEFASRMMDKGVYVVAFSYPVVPKGKARIRTQVCASHTKEDIDFIVKCFCEVREEMGLN